jgi:geranylgeranyl diphosphate synthase type II
MDDDDVRRGQPTNHKIYGEAEALLSGDGLLTMSFGILAQTPSPRAATAVALVSEAAGPNGMVGGQALDIEMSQPTLPLLREVHRRKTGALIRVSVEAAAVLCEVDPHDVKKFRTYGEQLGLAFQLADDLQDFDPKNPETVNFASALGVAKTREHLEEASHAALGAIADLGEAAEGLRQMVHLNLERV